MPLKGTQRFNNSMTCWNAKDSKQMLNRTKNLKGPKRTGVLLNNLQKKAKTQAMPKTAAPTCLRV